MKYYRTYAAWLLLGWLACGPLAQADFLTQGFESGWPAAGSFGDYSDGTGWELTSAAIKSGGLGFKAPTEGSYAAFLQEYSGSTNATLQTPLLTNGVGTLIYSTICTRSEGYNVWVLETAGTNGLFDSDPILTITNSVDADWTAHTNVLDIYEPVYLRWRKTGDSGSTQRLGLDAISMNDPPARVALTGTVTDPDPVYIDQTAHVFSTVTPKADATLSAVKTYWKVGAAGTWTNTPMSDTGDNVWRTDTAIPGQAFGLRVFYYVAAEYSGYESDSPATDPSAGATAPYYYDIQQRAFETGYGSLAVIDDLVADMELIGDQLWEGVAEPAAPVTNATLRFRGVTTNALETHTWGDDTPAFTTPPLVGTAVLNQDALLLAGTNSGQIVARFNETNLAYDVRQAVYHDFTGWTINDFGSGSDRGWEVANASIKTDSDRKHIGQACYLDSNGVAYVRSPYLEQGIGRISFWYRNWHTNESPPATEFYVQKSKTGGTDPNDWITIDTRTDITAQGYGRFEVLINDRNHPYVRILNSTNAAARARLCLDNVLVSQAGAGVIYTNLVLDPPAPSVIDPVTVSIDAETRANASNRVVTLHYRQGASGDFTAIETTRAGDTFTADSAIPAVMDGETNVQYYFKAEFEGYESELAAPLFYPEDGSNAPAFYSAAPAVTFSNPGRVPASPTIDDIVTVSINITAAAGVENLSAWLAYRTGTSGDFDAVALTPAGGDTYEGNIPRGQVGVMQYYFGTSYHGSTSTNLITAVYPTDGESDPLQYSNTDVFSATQDFNDWDGAPITTFGDYESDGWRVQDAVVRGSALGYYIYGGSGYACALMPAADSERSSIITPLLPDGVGVLRFKARNNKDAENYFEIRTSSDGTNFNTTVASDMNAGFGDWNDHEFFINLKGPVYLQIIKTGDNTTDLRLTIENIEISYPPAMVEITGVESAPAYPSHEMPITISCAITTPTLHPAMNIRAWVYHGLKDSNPAAWSAVAMTRGSGDSFTATIPSVYEADQTVAYYIKTEFNGYHYDTDRANFSPTYYPQGEVVETTQYYARPTSGFPSIGPLRRYDSPFDQVDVTGNFDTVTLDQIADDVWQGVINVNPTNQLSLNLQGLNRRDSELASPVNVAWGDTNQWRYSLPVIGTTDEDGTNIVLTGNFDGQYAVTLDVNTGEYILLRADYQDFDDWVINDDLFSAGIAGGTSWTQDFEAWGRNDDLTFTTAFQDYRWTNFLGEAWTAFGTNTGWVALQFRMANAGLDRRRMELRNQAYSGGLRQGDGMLAEEDGVGVINVGYRAVDTTPYPTVYSGPGVFTNFTITATVDASDTHDDLDTEAYIGIIYRYQSATNYYEARFEQIVEGANYGIKPRLYRRAASGFTLLRSGTLIQNTWLRNASTISVRVTSANAHSLKWGTGSTWQMNNQSDPSITAGGSIGFTARDASLRVSEVNVNEIGVGDVYTESFTNAPLSVWATGSNGWVHNEEDGRYERIGRFNDPLQLMVGTIPEGGSPNDYTQLDIAADLTNITSLAYATSVVNVHKAGSVPDKDLYAAIFQGEGSGILRLSNFSVSGWRAPMLQTNANWIAGNGRVIAKPLESGNALELRASRAVNIATPTQYLRSEAVESVGPFAFEYYIPEGSPDPTFILDYAIKGSDLYTEILSTNLTEKGEWRTWAEPINFDPGASEIHLRLVHASTSSNAILYIDDVRIFDYQLANTNAWLAYNALLTDNTTPLSSANLVFIEGKERSGFLNNSTNANIQAEIPYTDAPPYIQSPYMPLGIGEISFWTRRWDVSGSGAEHARLVIAVSPTAAEGTWNTLLATNISTEAWERIVLTEYDTTNHFVRFYNDLDSGPVDRLSLEGLLIKAPLATDMTITNVIIIPDIPLSGEPVTIRAELTDYILNPTVTSVRVYYHTNDTPWATWGDDAYLDMVPVATHTPPFAPPVYTYESVGTIPGLPTDSVVQYRVKAEFDGRLMFPGINGTKILDDPGENPNWYEPENYNESLGGPDAENPYYIVFSCLPGSVWINEINAHQNAWPWGAREYIELCGEADVSIHGWKLNIVNINGSIHSSYMIVSNSTFLNETNGYGFWVLGDEGVGLPIDQTFTNTPDLTYQMHLPNQGGIQLVRGFGGVEDAVSWGTTFGYVAAQNMQGYTFAGQDLYYLDAPLALIGTNTFTWAQTGSYTAGSENDYQDLGQNQPPPTFEIEITALEFGPEIVLWTTTTNGWTPRAMYSTNLLVSNAWDDVTNVQWTVSNDQFRIWFPAKTNNPVFYRIHAED